MNPRISIDPAVCHGKLGIRKTRVLVSPNLSDLAAGKGYDQIIESYPNVTSEDIQAAREFGSEPANSGTQIF